MTEHVKQQSDNVPANRKNDYDALAACSNSSDVNSSNENDAHVNTCKESKM